MTPDDLVERVALAFCGKAVPCKMCRNDAKRAIAIVLEEAAQIAEPQVDDYSIEYHIRNDIADAIREMIPSGTTPAQDDNANSK
jgi:recombinational DNA repair protein RecR